MSLTVKESRCQVTFIYDHQQWIVQMNINAEQNILQTCEKQETRVYRVTVNQAVEENWFQLDTVNSGSTRNEIVDDSKPTQGNIIVTEATVELPPKHIRAALGDSNNRMEDIISQFQTQNNECKDNNPLETRTNTVDTESEDAISVMVQNQEPAIDRKQHETEHYGMDW